MFYRVRAIFSVACMLCALSIKLYATVPDRAAPDFVSKGEMTAVLLACRLNDKLSPAGERLVLKYHYLYRSHDGCERGKFGPLCPSILIGIQGKSCSSIFYSGPDANAVSIGEASILVPKAKADMNRFRDQKDVQAFSMETRGGLIVVVDRSLDPVFYMREYKE